MKSVVVIGAGPAGCVAASLLARRGVAVTLVEKSRFPRDKVCGECLSALGVETLERNALLAPIRALAPSTLTRTRIVATNGSRHTLPLDRPMWGVRRSHLDEALLREAAARGASIEQPATVTAIEATAAGVRVHLRDRTIEASVALLADGTSALLGGRPVATGDFGIKAHFQNVDADRETIELVGLGGGAYAGLAPIDGGLFNAAWTVPAGSLRAFGGDIEALFRSHVERHPHLRHAFAPARRAGPWLSCPLPRFAVRRDWPANVVPLGNAAAALEPVGGEGMGLAIRSAELAATAVADAFGAGVPVDVRRLRKSFDQLWRTRRAACRAAAMALADASIGPLAVELARTVPAIARGGLRLIGK